MAGKGKFTMLVASLALALFSSHTARAALVEGYIILADGSVYATTGAAAEAWGTEAFINLTLSTTGESANLVALGNVNSLSTVVNANSIMASGSSGCVTLSAVGWTAGTAILVVEVIYAGYLTYQLVDATIDYSKANDLGNQLQQALANAQAQLAQNYPSSCCCLKQGGSNTNPGDYFDQSADEWSCRTNGGTPTNCYNGFPLTPDNFAALPSLFQQADLPYQCAYMNGYRFPVTIVTCQNLPQTDCQTCVSNWQKQWGGACAITAKAGLCLYATCTTMNPDAQVPFPGGNAVCVPVKQL